jgi:putative SOS response-associated peptidase YedK
MCGRMNISDHEGIQWLLNQLGISMSPTQEPRFNVAPTLTIDVVTAADNEPVLAPMSWGISMKTKGKKGQPVVRRIPNSRDDKVWTSYMWRYLIPEQRCLIPVNGFYEWKRENRKLISAYHITSSSGPAMFFGGIYKKPKEAGEMPEVSIVTTSANNAMGDVHDRMPVILSSSNAASAWIQDTDRGSLDELMLPANDDALVFTQVSDYVNKSTNEGVGCVEPVVSPDR